MMTIAVTSRGEKRREEGRERIERERESSGGGFKRYSL
jgi:hypothetical protein